VTCSVTVNTAEAPLANPGAKVPHCQGLPGFKLGVVVCSQPQPDEGIEKLTKLVLSGSHVASHWSAAISGPLFLTLIV
jgi:hypothetical protein